MIGGRKVHPCTSIPGGLTKGITKEQDEFKTLKNIEPGEAVETLVEIRVKTS